MRKILIALTGLLLSLMLAVPVVSADNSRKLFSNNDYIYEVAGDGSLSICYYIGYDENVTVPAYIGGKRVSAIGERAFCGTDVRSVTVSEGISKIMDEAFFFCYKLEEVVLPESLKTVGLGAFRDCMDLRKVTFPEDNCVLGRYMFYGCTSLEDVNLPKNTQTIPVGMFGYCSSLIDITLPLNVEEISSYSFYSSGLVSVWLTPKLRWIDNMAFAQSKRLESVTPMYSEGECYIACDAFDGCAIDFPLMTGAPTTGVVGPTDAYEGTGVYPDWTDPAVPPIVETTPDPTETAGVAGDDSTIDEQETTSPLDDVRVPETTTQDGYYMGSTAGFLESEVEVISSVHADVSRHRQELIELAWNVRMLGDSNTDGRINVKDATNIQRYIANLIDTETDNFDYKNSDANTDGQVNIKDATIIQKLVAGLVESLC